MIDNDYVSFYIGQVVSINDAYKSAEHSNTFSINVKIKINNIVNDVLNVIPSNNNIKQIPVIGENVLIYQGYSNKTSYINREQQWYYLTTLNIQSNVNNNILPTITPSIELESEFKDTNVISLQPYIGDILIEGRWGNTIRLGSTNSSSDKYYKQSPWAGETVSDPIITISTRNSTSPSDLYSTENLQTDASSVYLTSTQKISTLKLHNNLNNKVDAPTVFKKSQFIGVADRIILQSKTDIIALDSNSSIELNSPMLIIGNKNDDQKEWGLHSTEVIEMFNEFFYLITLGGLKDSSGMPLIVDPTFADSYLNLREKLLNKKIKQDIGD